MAVVSARLVAAASLAAAVALVAAGAGAAATRCPVSAATVSAALGVPMRMTDAPRSGNELCAFGPRSPAAAYPAVVLFRFPDPQFKAKTLRQMRALFKAYPAADLTELGGGAFMAETRSAQLFFELYSSRVKAQVYFTNGYGQRRALRSMRALFAAL
ncbi:MAG: hypothetical protein ABUS54_08695 [Actinomycetota bacterium]